MTLPGNKDYFGIKNVNERAAAIAIITEARRVATRSADKEIVVIRESPQFTKSAIKFLGKNLGHFFKEMTFSFDEKEHLITATLRKT